MRYFKWDKYHLLVKIIAIALVIALAIVIVVFLWRSLSVVESERANLQVELNNATAERDALQSKVSSIERFSAKEKWEEAATAWEAVEAPLNAWREAWEVTNTSPDLDVDLFDPVALYDWTENTKDWLVDFENTIDARDRTLELLEVAWETTAVAWDVSALLWDIEEKDIAAIAAKSAALQANKAAIARRNARLATTDLISSMTLDLNVRLDVLNVISRILIENQDLESRVRNLDVATEILDVVVQSTDKIVSTKRAIFDTAGDTAWEAAGDTAAYFAQASDSLADVYEGFHWQNVRDIWTAVANSYQLVAEENTGAMEARISAVNAIKETRDAYNATAGSEESEGGT